MIFLLYIYLLISKPIHRTRINMFKVNNHLESFTHLLQPLKLYFNINSTFGFMSVIELTINLMALSFISSIEFYYLIITVYR